MIELWTLPTGRKCSERLCRVRNSRWTKPLDHLAVPCDVARVTNLKLSRVRLGRDQRLAFHVEEHERVEERNRGLTVRH
jgi:hypothetical protein